MSQSSVRTWSTGAVLVAAIALAILPVAPPGAAEGNEAPGAPAAARSLAAGDAHTCARTTTGAVKCWGQNTNGQLGLGDTANRGDGANEMGSNLPAVSLGSGLTATALTAGSTHTCALLQTGAVKCWGNNTFGRLGLGNQTARGDNANEMGDDLPAVSLGTGRTATAIVAGERYTCALLDNATVKCWGLNDNGQLGLGDTANRGDAANEMGDNLPAIDLGTGRTAVAITAGTGHTCAILDNASVKCWGLNASGQLGLGDTNTRGDGANEMGTFLGSVALGSGRTATAISASNNHTCAVLDNATVKCWGSNTTGQLGQGDTNNRGDAAGEMSNSLLPVGLGTGRTATSVSAGANHTCARLDNATVKCWGSSNTGQLGQGDTTFRGDNANEMGDNLPALSLGTGRTSTAVTAGASHSCVRLDNAAVKCWGISTSGQLGQGDTTTRGDTANEMGNNLPPIAIVATGLVSGTVSDAVSASPIPGAFVTALRTNDFSVGGGGVADASGAYVAELAPGSYFLYLIDPAGKHTDGFFGPPTTVTITDGGIAAANPTMNPTRGSIGGTITEESTGQPVAGVLVAAVNLTSGGLSKGAVTGIDGRYQMGDLRAGNYTMVFLDPAGGRALEYHGDSPDVSGATQFVLQGGDTTTIDADLSAPTTSRFVAGNDFHNCAARTSGSVRCWGQGTFGQIGLGDPNNRGDAPNEMGANLPAVNLGTGRTATALTAGEDFSCALLDNGTVKCWGRNLSGSLGQGDAIGRGDGANEMGDNLPAIALGTGRTATAITAGDDFACALLDNGTVKCWGRNVDGQLGQGDTTTRGDGPNEMGDNLLAVNLGTGRTATAITAGQAYACARLDDATVKCWGRNVEGQLGLGDTVNRGDGANEMGDNLPVVSLGTGRTALAVAAGRVHSCALLDNGQLKCWGDNAQGGLGLGNTATRGDAANEMGDNLPAVSLGTGRTARFVDAGVGHTCAGLDNGTLKCWGHNNGGQLGRGDTANRGDGPNEMGDNLPVVNLGLGRTATTVQAASLRTCASLDDLTVKCWGLNFNGSLGLGDNLSRGDNPEEMSDALPALQLESPPLPSGFVEGVISDSVSAAPISGAWALLLRTSDFSVAGGGVADGTGAYTARAEPGTYFLYLIDPSGTHVPGFSSPPSVTITNGDDTDVDPTMAPSEGRLSGTVTHDPSGTPNPGAWVLAIGPTGLAGGTVTAANGSYSITGLLPGTYRAGFLDPVGGGTLEYHSNSPDFAGATPFGITAGASTTIDAALIHP